MKPMAITAAALLALAALVYPQIHGSAPQATDSQSEVQKFLDQAAITNMFEVDAARTVTKKSPIVPTAISRR